MTYADLLLRLEQATPEQLKQDVTVYVTESGEFYGVVPDYPFVESDASWDVLDPGHLYLVI